MSGDTETLATWDEPGLIAAGLGPPHRLDGLEPAHVPREPGVYVILRLQSDGKVAFRDVGSAGRFRDRAPNVDVEQLAASWVDGIDVLYVGKANDLRQRIGLLRHFGQGEPGARWGGRYIWQLEDAAGLRAAWRSMAARCNVAQRAALIDAFVEQHGTRPFGNRQAPACSARAEEERR